VNDACTAHFASHLGQSANCTEALIPDDARYGEGIFGNQELECDLGVECYASFDESVAMAVVPGHGVPGRHGDRSGQRYRERALAGGWGVDGGVRDVARLHEPPPPCDG
jgi:hypothetical protein